jgi:hypothetical protein
MCHFLWEPREVRGRDRWTEAKRERERESDREGDEGRQRDGERKTGEMQRKTERQKGTEREEGGGRGKEREREHSGVTSCKGTNHTLMTSGSPNCPANAIPWG